ncbi:uncharacterized protein METZ01_LOCUS489290, partial [marine metagenome]
INQGYDEGEYNTGYFNMDDEDAYTYAYINEDGSYDPKGESYREAIMKYNKAMQMFKE